jgi:osmoprotectant transport system ATP-binding protein
VRRGEALALLGSSGSGKTTLLRLVNRLVEASEGAVFVDGRDVRDLEATALRLGLGYVLQDAGLFPHLTVEENVAVVPRLLGWDRTRIARRAAELLELVRLPGETYGRRFPEELSGGQRQRVGVARALAGEPSCLLMDEPFGALDAVTRDELQRELVDLRGRLGLTVIFVTHDLVEALVVADRIAVMHAGRVEQVGEAAEVVARPATEFVSALVEGPRRRAAALLGGAS